LLREGPFADIWVQPAAGDAGGALGAALFTWHQLLDKPRLPGGSDSQKGSLLGPAFSTERIQNFLDQMGVRYTRIVDEPAHADHVARLLMDGNVVGWFHGRMEFGPRALGARSILADARSPNLQATMNLKIKFRESFRPFAPVVLQERAHEWFDMPEGRQSPYMLFVAPVHQQRRVPICGEQLRQMSSDPDLKQRVDVVRSTVPAITHVDYSARVQTVDRARHPRLHGLLQMFWQKTGCPVLVNTSFNVRGEPIVCTPEDAYRCFVVTEMDALVLEDFVILKSQLDGAVGGEKDRAQHLAQFQLD
jgi:carbamoyltransferase